MKKLLLILLTLLAIQQVKASAISGDIIYLNNEEWELLEKPIAHSSMLWRCLNNILPPEHPITIGVLDYTAFWEIKDDYLCLHHLEVLAGSHDDSIITYSVDSLRPAFQHFYKDGTIQARWFSGEIRAGKGELITYYHAAFMRNYETEQVMTVQKGKIIKSETFDNYLIPGLSIKDVSAEISRRFPWDKFPEYRGQKIAITIHRPQITDDGHFIDAKVAYIRLQPSETDITGYRKELLAIIIKNIMRDVYPLQRFFINGKYTLFYLAFNLWIEEETDENTDEHT